MTLPRPIASSQTDAKSPVDDNLMDSIREDLDYLDEQQTETNPLIRWEISGDLSSIYGGKIKRIAGGALSNASVFNSCKLSLEKSGISGNLEIDIRKHVSLAVPISGIVAQFSDTIQSITNIAPALSTQSIARAAAPVNTQSISRVKSQHNIQAIIPISGTNYAQINIDGATDSDYVVGQKVVIDGADDPLNDGTFPIVEVNRSGGINIVVENASAVLQAGAGGTLDLQLFSYNLTNPANAQFVAGESALFASHTDPENDGTFEIYKVNESGNNILVFNEDGLEQAGIAGTASVLRWIYTFSAAPSLTDFIVGEKIKASGHSNAANDGNFPITAVGSGGDNITVFNPLGVAQGSPAGTVNTNRWIYALSTDQSSNVDVTDDVTFFDATDAENNGTFSVKEVNRLGSNNLVVYNEAGITQAGAVGIALHSNKLIKFASDQSAQITTDSIIELIDTADDAYNESDIKTGFQVLEVNRGGGANYNAVIKVPDGGEFDFYNGMVQVESKSIFTIKPSMPAEAVSLRGKRCLKLNSTDFVNETVPADTSLYLWINTVHEGSSQDLTVTLL